MLSMGAMHLLRERLLTSSDGVDVNFCDRCGSPAYFVPDKGLVCSEGVICASKKFTKRFMPYASTLLLQELRALGIDFRMLKNF